MKRMNFRVGMLLTALAFSGWGCVEIEQEVHVNHDGSGKIVEKIALSPRGVRMLEAAGREGGAAGALPALFSEEAFQERLKAMGEVTVESRQEVKLPDGRRQLQNVYTFKNIGKIRLLTVPTCSYKTKTAKELRGALDGSLRFTFRPEYSEWGRTYRETITVEAPNPPGVQGQVFMSPAERQKFIRVLPVFLDMVQDIRLSIVLVAPIEEFEEPAEMLWNLPVDRNRVTLFKVEGRELCQSPSAVLQLIMNEVTGSEAPGVFLPWSGIHRGRGMRFMKSTPAPKKESGLPPGAQDPTAAVPPNGADRPSAPAPAPVVADGSARLAISSSGGGDNRTEPASSPERAAGVAAATEKQP
jgi:hypothetical protein